MKKISRKIPLLVCLIVFIISVGAIWILVESQGRVFAQERDQFVTKRVFERVLTLQERQPIYMKGEALTQIGELEANQPVAITGEDEAYYELRLGNMTAFVRKGPATVEKKKLLTVLHTERFAAIHTLQKTAVYEDADLQSSVILEMEEGYRYPVIGEEEDWYILAIGERPGYIAKQSVALDEGLPVLVYHQVLPRELMRTMASTISLES